MIKITETIDTIWTSGAEGEFKLVRKNKEVRVFGIKIFKKITIPIVLYREGKKWENLYL